MRFPILPDRYDNNCRPQTFGNLARVSKATARKLYDAGYDVVMVPCKMCPILARDNPMGMAYSAAQSRDTYNDVPHAFDTLAANFAQYNCNYETGYYLSYWAQFVRPYSNNSSLSNPRYYGTTVS